VFAMGTGAGVSAGGRNKPRWARIQRDLNVLNRPKGEKGLEGLARIFVNAGIDALCI
jgi:hypothetical protein